MSDTHDIMDAETFRKFQNAAINGQFSNFLKTVKSVPVANLQEPVCRNMWLFYSAVLTRAFENKKVSATVLTSFVKHADALAEVFLALPLTTHAFWGLQAITGFYKGCQLSGLDTSNTLFDPMLDKALLTPNEQMSELNTGHIFPLTKLCSGSSNEKLHQVVRHYTQSITEQALMQCKRDFVFLILPYVSFNIDIDQWAGGSEDVRQFVQKHANLQQARRLNEQLPDVSRLSSRKI